MSDFGNFEKVGQQYSQFSGACIFIYGLWASKLKFTVFRFEKSISSIRAKFGRRSTQNHHVVEELDKFLQAGALFEKAT